MQATLDAFALKPFTKALTCLSKYGDELAIYATSDALSMSATNSSKSAYCRFKYDKQFFSKYTVRRSQPDATNSTSDIDELSIITGQLMTKTILSILKHRTVEKSVERCEISIVEGGNLLTDDRSLDEDEDGPESKLTLRLFCKHGVVKTHRLLLLTPTTLMAPGVPDALNESRLTIGPKAMKDMIEHFPPARGIKSDPQLIWNFGETEVGLKSLESSFDTKGRTPLSTELTISADEFDVYNVYTPPVTLAFHLREFNATIAFADSMSLTLDLRFTDPAAPLFIDVDGDNSETLFVISTSQVHGSSATVAPNYITNTAASNKKREREDTSTEAVTIKKSMKVVQQAEPTTTLLKTRPQPQSSSHNPMLPPSVPMLISSPSRSNQGRHNTTVVPPIIPPDVLSLPPQQINHQPLFLPDSSQPYIFNLGTTQQSVVGLDDMNAEELVAMLEEEGEEVAFDFASQKSAPPNDRPDVSNQYDLFEELELAPTQSSPVSLKAFQPLFED